MSEFVNNIRIKRYARLLEFSFVGAGYFFTVYLLVLYLCFIVLKLDGTDVFFTYCGYVFPCHSRTYPVHYNKFAGIFATWGRAVISLFFMAVGYVILLSELRKRKLLFYIGIIFVNTLSFYAIFFLLQMFFLYHKHKEAFYKLVSGSSIIGKIGWFLIIAIALFASFWTVKKQFVKSDIILLCVAIPASFLFCYFIWFRHIGPIALP